MLHLKYLVPLIFFAASFAKAEGPGKDPFASEATHCVTCSASASASGKDATQAREIRNTVNTGYEAQSVAAVADKMGWSDGCYKFANGNSYGPWGKVVIRELESNKYDELLRGTADLRELCPGYDSMNRDAKQSLWVTVITAMANHESSCRETPPLVKGPNGTLVGLMQLHLGKENQYTENCPRNGGRKAETSIVCAMNMMNSSVGKYGDLFSNNSYWEVLRPNSRKKIYAEIKDAIKSHNLCR